MLERFAIAAFVLGMCATAAAQDASLPRPGSWSAPRYQECKSIRIPDQLPSASQLIDSATAADVVQADSEIRGRTLLSVRFDSTGRLTRFAAIESDLAPAAVKRLARDLASLASERAAGAPLSVRLRIDSRSTTTITVERSEWCEAHLRDPVEYDRLVERVLGTSGLSGDDGSVLIRVVIMANGHVTAADVLRVTGPNVGIPPVAQRVALGTNYNPALDDRIAVMSVDTVSLEIYHTKNGKTQLASPCRWSTG